VDLSRILTDRHEICTQVWCGVKPETLCANFFTLPLKYWQGKPKLRQTSAGLLSIRST